MLNPLVPLFVGQPIFGDPAYFSSTKLATDPPGAALYASLLPARIDAFLGLPTGTTQFGALGNGVVFAVSGQMFDLSAEGIANQQTLLLSYAGVTSLWLRPTGLAWPANAEFLKNAHFRSQEVVFSPTATSPGNQYTCTYNMIIRTLGNS